MIFFLVIDVFHVPVQTSLEKHLGPWSNCFSRVVRTRLSIETYSHLWFSWKVFFPRPSGFPVNQFWCWWFPFSKDPNSSVYIVFYHRLNFPQTYILNYQFQVLLILMICFRVQALSENINFVTILTKEIQFMNINNHQGWSSLHVFVVLSWNNADLLNCYPKQKGKRDNRVVFLRRNVCMVKSKYYPNKHPPLNL